MDDAIHVNVQVVKLEALRQRLGRSVAFTYAATTRCICAAIRKLSCLIGPDKTSVWRGVRGTLPSDVF